MTTYTDNDVQQLVSQAKYTLKQRDAYNTFAEHPVIWKSLDLLDAALKPFLPDPDAPAIEKMAEVAVNSRASQAPNNYYEWDELSEGGKDRARRDMKAVLNLLKAEGIVTCPHS